jgi:cell wall assembly regulator SMI1
MRLDDFPRPDGNRRPDDTARLIDAWQRIEQWYGATDPPLDPGFRPPVSVAGLSMLVQQLGGLVPESVEMLLRRHDGGVDGRYPLPMRATEPTCWRMLSAAEIAAEAQRLSEVARSLLSVVPVRAEGPVAAVWWDYGWIPLCECGTGDLVCIDQAPPPGGTVGQLLLYAHDAPERRTLYAGLADWIDEAAGDLTAGRYRHERGVGLWPAGGLS